MDNLNYDTALQLAQQRARQYGAQIPFQVPQGQMVGGRYIAPNVLQYIAEGLRSFGGMRGEQLAQDEVKQLTQAKRQAVADALRGFTEKTQGTPENVAGDGMGPTRPAQAPDMREAYAQLIQSGIPALYETGFKGVLEDAKLAREEAQKKQLRRATDLLIENEQGQLVPNQPLIEVKKTLQAAQSQPYYTPVQTTEGIQVFDARTGKVQPMTSATGTVFKAPQFSPQLQADLTGAKTTGKMIAEAETQKVLDAPKVIAETTHTLKLLDDLMKHPGLEQAVGMSRLLPLHLISGTPARDFENRLEEIKGKQFLQAFESLKGGGAITELEGQKAQAAISRMNPTSSEDEFKKAVSEFKEIVQAAQKRALAVQQNPTATSANPILPPGLLPRKQAAPSITDLLNKY